MAIARVRGLGVAQVAVFLPHGADEAAQADTVDPQLAPAATSTPTVVPVTASTPATIPVTAGSKMQERIEKIRGAEDGSRIATFSAGAYAGKNIIVIQVEALNTMVMQKKIGGVEITPNLNALINESWYFPNTYSETGMGNTADAEFIVNTSMYPPKTQAAPVAYVDRKIPALPRLLGQAGLRHLHRPRQQGGLLEPQGALRRARLLALLRSQLLPLGGHVQRDGFLGRGPGQGDQRSCCARSTRPRRRSTRRSSRSRRTRRLTWCRRTGVRMRTPADYKGSLMGDYISSESYSDFALGQFISQLRADGVWDDSIVVIYGDHTAMNENSLAGKDGRAAKELLGRSYSAADRQRVPLIIHLPGQKKAELVTATAGQVDIMPTIADLVGLDLRGTPHMGRSLFVNSNALVPMRSYLPGGTFANDKVVFTPGVGYKDGKAYSIEQRSQRRQDRARAHRPGARAGTDEAVRQVDTEPAQAQRRRQAREFVDTKQGSTKGG